MSCTTNHIHQRKVPTIRGRCCTWRVIPVHNLYRKADTPPSQLHPSHSPTDPTGSPAPDNVLFQNLLGAEWIIYSFYQQAVEVFSSSEFTNLGLLNSTYRRVAEIRDNEAGQLRIFQDQISNHSLKPGPCKYEFGFHKTTPKTFLALQVYIQVSSMVFLTGLSHQANLTISKSGLTAIGQVETSHDIWSLLGVFNTSPFSGPADTVYPYANQILDITNTFVVPGSCPKANPVYPNPRQGLPLLASSKNSTSATGFKGLFCVLGCRQPAAV